MIQESHMGDDGWDVLSDFIERKYVKSILLVTGGSSYVTCGAKTALEKRLQGLKVRHVRGFKSNPNTDDLIRILNSGITHEPYDLMIAVGGGTVMDMAKLIKAFGACDSPIIDHLMANKAVSPTDAPIVAIPTTAGSGSEATHFAVIYHGNQKYSVAHDKLLPDLAIIIPSLLLSLPANVAASSGMDTLCQGIESFWSIHSTATSQALAGEAITLAWASLKDSVLEKNSASIHSMARASHMAGKAINITKTTDPHSVSYALTSLYGISHGHAVGLLMPHFLNFNMNVSATDCLDDRGTEWVRAQLNAIAKLIGFKNPSEASKALIELTREIGLETRLSKLGVQTPENIEKIVTNGFNADRVKNNPRKLTKDHLRKILTKMIDESSTISTESSNLRER